MNNVCLEKYNFVPLYTVFVSIRFFERMLSLSVTMRNYKLAIACNIQVYQKLCQMNVRLSSLHQLLGMVEVYFFPLNTPCKDILL